MKELRQKGIPVATVPFHGLVTAVSRATFAIVGAESVLENGGMISSSGTQQLGLLIKSFSKDFYIAAESHKFVRVFPLSPGELGLEDGLLDFYTDSNEDCSGKPAENGHVRLDFIAPDLITALVTESGILAPNAVSEELIKLWN